MTNYVLTRLLSDDFDASVGFALPAPAMRRVLQQHGDVRAVWRALRRGEVPPSDFNKFVSLILGDFKRGERLAGDLALASLAVAVERIHDEFANEFLRGLAALRLEEVPIASRIAREVLKYRAELPKTEIRSTTYETGIRDRKIAKAAFGRVRAWPATVRCSRPRVVRHLRYALASTVSVEMATASRAKVAVFRTSKRRRFAQL
jgi:hypothetical protein